MEGVERESFQELVLKEESDLMLVWDSRSRQFDCEVPLHIDFMDFFAVRSEQGWYRIMLPTATEKQVYHQGPFHGLIILCLVECKRYIYKGEGGCAGGELSSQDLLRGAVNMRVNGETATVSPFESCLALKHQGRDSHLFSADSNGRYEVKFRVQKEAKLLQISSIIVI